MKKIMLALMLLISPSLLADSPAHTYLHAFLETENHQVYEIIGDMGTFSYFNEGPGVYVVCVKSFNVSGITPGGTPNDTIFHDGFDNNCNI